MSFIDHKGEVEYSFSQKTVFNALLEAAKKMDGIELDCADEVSGHVTFKAGVSLRSWGENIPVQLVKISNARTRMQILSTPKTGVMFGGAMDLGKNRENIDKIIKAVSDVLSTKIPETENSPLDTKTVGDELLKLKQLMDQGVLSQNEFEEQKKKLLNSQSSSLVEKPQSNPSSSEPVRIESKGGDHTIFWAILFAIIFFIIMMMMSSM